MNTLLSLLYPPLCLHCAQKLENDHYLCPACFFELELLDPAYRCVSCFSELESIAQKICPECRHYKRSSYRLAAAFEYSGPLTALLSGLATRGQPYLAKGAAGFLVMQWTKLNWEKPDLIMPIPGPIRRKIKRGYDHNILLAEQVSQMLQVPLEHGLRYDDEESPPYRLKGLFEDKRVLLIGDRTSALKLGAERVTEGFPAQVGGVALYYDTVPAL